MPVTKLEQLRRRVTQLEKAIVGMIIPYGGAKEPQGAGRLFCDGRALSQADYPELHAVIGTNFGAGTTDENGKEITGKDFNLPDLRGRFVRGVDDSGTTRDPDAETREAQQPGGNTGHEVGSVQDDALKNTITTMRRIFGTSVKTKAEKRTYRGKDLLIVGIKVKHH